MTSTFYKLILMLLLLPSMGLAQSAVIEQKVAINQDDSPPRNGTILDMGASKKAMKLPTLADTSGLSNAPEGSIFFNQDLKEYQYMTSEVTSGTLGLSNSTSTNTKTLFAIDYPVIILTQEMTVDGISMFITGTTGFAMQLDMYELRDNCNTLAKVAETAQIQYTSLQLNDWNSIPFSNSVTLSPGKYVIGNVITSNTVDIRYETGTHPNVSVQSFSTCTDTGRPSLTFSGTYTEKVIKSIN